MSNPRPCVCGHPESKHGSGLPAFGNRCIACYFSPGDWSGCIYYRKRPRKEPLRARRSRTRVTLRPSTEPAQSWSEGVTVWAQADIGSGVRDSLSASSDPYAEYRLSDGRVVTAKVQRKDDRWHVLWPPEVSGQTVMHVRIRVPAS